MPQLKKGPKLLNDLLEKVYKETLAFYLSKNYSKEEAEKLASQTAWKKAKEAGWKQNKTGKWVKHEKNNQVMVFEADQEVELSAKLGTPNLDPDGNIITKQFDNAFLADVSLLAGAPEDMNLPPLTEENIKENMEQHGVHLNAVRVISKDYKAPENLDKIADQGKELVVVDDIPIISSREIRGMHFDLKQLAENFKLGIHKWVPGLTIGHDPNIQRKSGYPKLGEFIKVWVQKFTNKSGETYDILYGTAKNVPKIVADLIRNGTYNRISAEVFTQFPFNQQVDLIQFENLSIKSFEIINGYEEEKAMPKPFENLSEEERIQLQKLRDRADGADKLLFEKLYNTNENLSKESSEIKSKLEKFETELTSIKADKEKSDKEKADLEAKLKDQKEQFAKVLVTQQINEINSYVDEKLTPTDKQGGISKENLDKLKFELHRIGGLVKLSKEQEKDAIPVYKNIVDLMHEVVKNKNSVINTGEMHFARQTDVSGSGDNDIILKLTNQVITEAKDKSGVILHFDQAFDYVDRIFNKDGTKKPDAGFVYNEIAKEPEFEKISTKGVV